MFGVTGWAIYLSFRRHAGRVTEVLLAASAPRAHMFRRKMSSVSLFKLQILLAFLLLET